MKADVPCEAREEPREGVTPEQLKELRTRTSQKTEEEKWFEVYRILFPADLSTAIPSPCE